MGQICDLEQRLSRNAYVLLRLQEEILYSSSGEGQCPMKLV